MDQQKTALVDRLKTANTVLVTVSKNPSVDQLAACIGLTLIINKLNKHGSAVFSGAIPPAIDFLKPEQTIEKNTDSLRDFIIALDRNKADKLRYKVEDQVVKIFITPYRTSLSESDLEFSQGDFNVELVIALGVTKQQDLDDTITSHGRILHDATVASINVNQQSSLGSINWVDPQASSLSELVYDMTKGLANELMDEQIATALLTGIVSETDRFSNPKTTSRTMVVSGELMAAGANQQLVANAMNPHMSAPANAASPSEGSLAVPHDQTTPAPEAKLPAPATPPVLAPAAPAAAAQEAVPPTPTAIPAPPETVVGPNGIQRDPDLYVGPDSKFMTEPPEVTGSITANSKPEGYDPSTDPLSNFTTPAASEVGIIDKPEKVLQPSADFTPPPPNWTPPEAPSDSKAPDAPIEALNAMPVAENLNSGEPNPQIVTEVPGLTHDNAAPPVPPPIPMNFDKNPQSPQDNK